MTKLSDKEVLEKAIQKAIDGGWKPFAEEIESWFCWKASLSSAFTRLHRKDFTYSLYDLLFDKEFAKAVWGDSLDKDGGCKVHHKIHQFSVYEDDYIDPADYHLMEMVIAPNIFDYLREHI